ncbi:CDP-diacylglycerol--glycerol-3-phosphate 3-phosphatidyltransferase [Kytococcus sedentarius]|uniref:CDP-diacylglycerol--glycerol-3-phosphate 3-phosphatidyltransferase n=1 Tax=Kytococcus sedentarius TaxID=1276 RepID=UPI00194F1F5C|nr:CDP-diacylglycerol--glycerol-3-phosphate 3-phosphatidyltransferase [Kytococcus sedentarius]QRO86663.1 CDP-diacylglycerol--glycerol-3-phosphate 3-phosphatidyltransferase [Kytococcus sedentarius]
MSAAPGTPAAGSDQAAAREPSPWNIANALTVLRILMVPVFVWLLLRDPGAGGEHLELWWAFAVFALAAITDRIDGDLARRHNLITSFGKIADPIADKALIGSALICLSAIDLLPWWVTIVILARELLITVVRFVVIRYGVMAASRGGKLKTVLQSVAVGLMLMPVGGVVATIAWVVMLAAVVVTVVTGIDYLLDARRLWARGRARS